MSLAICSGGGAILWLGPDYCPPRGMGEKPSPSGEDFSRPVGPETDQSRSDRRLVCRPVDVVWDTGYFLGGGESRIYSTERKAAEATVFRRLEPSLYNTALAIWLYTVITLLEI